MTAILYGKRDFAGVIKSRILRWGVYPGLSGWSHGSVITRAFIRGKQESKSEKGDIEL